MGDFDWTDLKGFLALARAGRLTTAAARLGIEHSTLSRRLAALETALGSKLFDRSPAGYALTEEGERMRPIAEEMERLALGAGDAVGGKAASVEGVVRVGSPEAFGSHFLAPRAARLKALHPALVMQLVAAPAIFSLARRDADLAISVSRPPAGRIKVSRLTDYDLGLFGADDYLDARPPIADLADLKQHLFVSYISDLLNFPELDMLRHVAPEGRIALESSNLVAQLRATIAGAGLCLLPAFLARSEPKLRRVLAEKIGFTRSLWMIVHEDLAGLARVKAVVGFVREEVAGAKGVFRF